MEQAILHYGLAILFLGAGIEGEPFALAGGVLVHRHWLSPAAATLAAIAGAAAVDQFWFLLSRRYRNSGIVHGIAGRPAFAQAMRLIERHPVGFALSFRFAYGVRAVAPVAIGVSGVPARLFVPLDLVAAIVWGAAFTGLGYLAGPAVEAAEARYGPGIAIAGIVVSGLALAYALRRGR